MVRLRLAVLAILMALTAPWVAPCLAATPAGHAQMPCCKAAGGSGPAVRPCCTPGDQPPLAPAQTAATTAAGAVSAIAPVPVPEFVPLVHVRVALVVPLQLQLRSTVLLI